MAVQELPAGQYDLIVSDVFNDMAVPYHLTTREFSAHLQRLLNPEGIYLVNLIVKVSKGRFLRSFVHTLQTLFPYVYVLSEGRQTTKPPPSSVAVPCRWPTARRSSSPRRSSPLTSAGSGRTARAARPRRRWWWRQPTERSRWPPAPECF